MSRSHPNYDPTHSNSVGASPITPQSASSQGPNFRTNVNRAKTKRWVEAKSYAYDGDDWGSPDDEEEDESVEHPPQPTTKSIGVRPQGQGLPSAPDLSYGDGRYGELQGQQPAPRNIMNPVGPSRGRSSIDQGDERRAFSGQPGYGSPQPQYPQQGPATSFSLVDPSQAPSKIQTQRRPSMEQQQNYPRGPPYGAPYSAGPRTRSRSNDRAPAYPSQPYSNPASISSSPRTQEPSAKFPPRKSSLSQQTPPVIPSKDVSPQRLETSASTAPVEPRERSGSATAKPLPFIRPADIYKRMAEEKEKERERDRQSQESSRPSIDTTSAKSREESPSHPALRQRGSSESVGKGGPRANLSLFEDQDPSGRMKPMLDPVAERKSEYGFENLVKSQASRENPTPPNEPLHVSPPSETSKPTSPPERPELPSASSNYSDRSLEGSLSDVHRASDFGMGFSGPSRDKSLRSSGLAPDQPNLPDSNLHHQPSYGYGSTVRQAFDNENRDMPPTPSSMGDSVMRSNSDSTSAISPIMSRGPGTAYTDNKTLATTPAATISEEPEQPRSRPTSSGTTGKFLPPVDDSEPLPPPRRPGQGRNSPSPGSSPARRAIMNFNDNIPRSELAEMSTVTPTDSQHSDTEAAIETRDYDSYLPATAYALPRSSVQSHKTLPDMLSTETRESPIPRSESPPKGAVRGLAGRFDHQDVPEPLQNMPTPKPTDMSRPSAAREQSFRPVLPGGWISYANTPGESTPATGPRPINESERDVVTPKTPELHVEAPFDPHTTPTAARKYAPAESETKSSMDPFAAAAAAGAALAGAFAVATGLEKHEQETPRLVRGDLDPSRHVPSNSNVPVSGTQSSASSKPPTPPPKDTPAQQESPKPEQSFFPLPLRHKGETSAEKSLTPQRSVVGGSPSVETPNEHQNDRLREEIMNTLTPRTSNVEGEDRPSFDHSRHKLNNDPTLREQVESTVIPREYESYWNESNEDAYPVPLIPVKSEEPAVAPTAAEPNFAELPSPESKNLPPLPAQIEGGLNQQPDGLPHIQHRFSWEATPPAEHPPFQESQVESGSPSTIRALNQPSALFPSTPNTTQALNQPSALPQSSFNSPVVYGEERLTEPQPHREAAETLDAPRSTQEPAVDSSVPGDTTPSDSPQEPATQPVSPLQHEYRPSGEFEHLGGSRDSQAISYSDDLRSPHDPNMRQSLDNVLARSVQRSSISEPQRGSLDSGRQNIASPTSIHEPRESLDGAHVSPLSPTNELMSFKKILALKSASERINAYNDARQQFSVMDTGLENWIRSTGQAVPEHEELISANGRPISGSGQTHKPSPSRSKFPRIGGFDTGEAFRPSHGRQLSGSFGPSKITGQQVQAKSKDLLHTASVFGGKANTTAKGWLAKSKTRFRSSGGGEKAIPPIIEPTPSPDAQPAPTNIPISSPAKPALGPRSFSRAEDERPSVNPTEESSQDNPISEDTHSPYLLPQATIASEDLSGSNLTVPSEEARSVSPSVSPEQDPFQDPANALTDSNQVSRQTSVSLARGSSTDSRQIPEVNEPGRAKSEVSAISEEIPGSSARTETSTAPVSDETARQENTRDGQIPSLETQRSNESEASPMPFISPIQTVSTANTMDRIETDQSKRTSISPLPSPTAARDEVGQLSVEHHQKSVSPMPPELSQERSSLSLYDERREPSPMPHPLAAPPIFVQDEIHKTDQPRQPEQPPDEQLMAVREFMKPEDLERLTRGPQFVSKLPQYDDPPRRTTQPRPFSFVSQGNEEVLPTAEQGGSQESVQFSKEDDLKGLEDELSGPPRSFSRPFEDPNISNHPAFRQEPSSRAPPTIPLPRSIQQPYSPQQTDPLDETDRMRYYSHREQYARQGTATEYQLPGGGPPSQPPPETTLTESRSRSRPRSGIFRSKSKSRDSAPPSRDQGTPDIADVPEQKKKRLSIFRTMSRTESVDSDRDSTRVNASGSRTDLMSQPYNQIPVHSNSIANKDIKDKDGRKIKKLQRSSTSNVVQEPGKKKRFSVSSLFGRSGTTGHSGKPSQSHTPLQQVQPNVDPQRIPHPPQPQSYHHAHPNPQRQSSFPAQPYPPQGYPPQGYPAQRQKQQGHPPQGYPPQGYFPQGYPPQGHAAPRYPPQGHPQHVYAPPQGHPQRVYAPPGYLPQGLSQGYPPQGHPSQGYPPDQYPPEKQPPQQQRDPQFAGQPPPPGGYYAPQNRNRTSDFIGGRRLSEQRVSEAKHDFENQGGFRGPYHSAPQSPPQPRPSPAHAPTPPSNPPAAAAPAPGDQAAPLVSPASSLRGQAYPPLSPTTRNGARAPDNFARGRTGPPDEHTRDLYRRSRSPRSHGYHNNRPEDADDPPDPAKTLGTFRTHSERSSMRGEQEGPWRLSIPEEPAERRQEQPVQPDPRVPDGRLSRLAVDTSGETYSPARYPLPDSGVFSPVNPVAAQIPPPPPPKIPLSQKSSPTASSHRKSASLSASLNAATTNTHEVPRNGHSPRPQVPLKDDYNNPQPTESSSGAQPEVRNGRGNAEHSKSPVELDARPTKDTESEEIVMSSTAYPGQEWQPENWGHWDGAD